jgi:hypothetical protein
MIDLFLNTGVQRLEVVKTDEELASLGLDAVALSRTAGSRWMPTGNPFARVFSQRRGTKTHFVLAIDTKEGPRAQGFIGLRSELFDVSSMTTFAISMPLAAPHPATVELPLAKVRFSDETPVPVSLILDIGNSRTCGLLLEDTDPESPIDPEQLRPAIFRSLRDPIDGSPEIVESTIEFVPPQWDPGPGQYVFTYSTHSGFFDNLKRLFTHHPMISRDIFFQRADGFTNDTVAAIGSNAIRWRRLTKHISPPTTGLSSPKRYLWSTTEVDSDWKYADYRHESGISLLPIRGDVLFYVPGDDSDDFLLQEGREYVASAEPKHPRYPKRALLVFFLYELLTTCYVHMNSTEYRRQSTVPLRPRIFRDLVLTYPSALGPAEVESFSLQARKAVKIFESIHCLPEAIRLHTAWDEGVTGQLSYVAGELRSTASRLYRLLAFGQEATVASFDFGGGTLDAAVARYRKGESTGEISCRVELVDGAFVGGDDLVRALVRDVVFPQLQEFIADTEGVARLVSLYRDRTTYEHTAVRIRLLREVFIRLAHRILEATSLVPVPSSIPLVDVAEVDSVDMLSQRIFGEQGIGRLRNWEFRLKSEAIDREIEKSFAPAIASILSRMPLEHLDAVVLAGRLASVRGVSALVESSVKSAGANVPVIPFHRVPGSAELARLIFGGDSIDPKVSVALGAAIAFTGAQGRAPSGLRFSVDYSSTTGPYYWGIVNPTTLEFSELAGGLLFSPDDPYHSTAVVDSTKGDHYIGRRPRAVGPIGPAMLRYRLHVRERGVIQLRRARDPKTNEEILSIAAAEGAAAAAELLPRSHIGRPYWLDTGYLWDQTGKEEREVAE